MSMSSADANLIEQCVNIMRQKYPRLKNVWVCDSELYPNVQFFPIGSNLFLEALKGQIEPDLLMKTIQRHVVVIPDPDKWLDADSPSALAMYDAIASRIGAGNVTREVYIAFVVCHELEHVEDFYEKDALEHSRLVMATQEAFRRVNGVPVDPYEKELAYRVLPHEEAADDNAIATLKDNWRFLFREPLLFAASDVAVATEDPYPSLLEERIRQEIQKAQETWLEYRRKERETRLWGKSLLGKATNLCRSTMGRIGSKITNGLRSLSEKFYDAMHKDFSDIVETTIGVAMVVVSAVSTVAAVVTAMK